MKNQDKIKDDYEARTRLEEALKVNKPLATAYYLKEELKLLWKQKDKETCDLFLIQWAEKAYVSGIRILQRMGNTLLGHRTGIYNWYDYNISTGPLEGFNNKIKTMKRQAYGYRDKEFFKLKIYALHEAKYSLTG